MYDFVNCDAFLLRVLHYCALLESQLVGPEQSSIWQFRQQKEEERVKIIWQFRQRKGENEDDIDDRGKEFHQRRWGREDDVEARRWRSRWAGSLSLIKHANNCLRRPADGGTFVVVVN